MNIKKLALVAATLLVVYSFIPSSSFDGKVISNQESSYEYMTIYSSGGHTDYLYLSYDSGTFETITIEKGVNRFDFSKVLHYISGLQKEGWEIKSNAINGDSPKTANYFLLKRKMG